MKIVSWNVNGLRSIYKKGFAEWLEKGNFDIVCLQEIKTQKEQLSFDFIEPSGYKAVFNSAEKKGYSGVAVYSKVNPRDIIHKLGHTRFDKEGRMLKLEFDKFTLINIYIPHGARDKRNLDYKLQVYRKLYREINKIKNGKVVLTGDFNVAHKDVDLARPESNKKNIMFTENERMQIKKIAGLGFIDTFRKFNKEGGHYTWWPYRVNARQRNLGWRIDYIFVSSELTSRLKNAFILKEVEGSDHCPIGIEIA